MIITDFLERNARLYGPDTALVVQQAHDTLDKGVTK